jgi:hypothetical protein
MVEAITAEVLSAVAGSQGWSPSGRLKARVGKTNVHVRLRSADRESPGKYRFSISPNALSADYELWICGDARTYYLIPIEVIKEMYSDPNAYQDTHHEEIKVVSVDAQSDKATYAAGAVSMSLKPFASARIERIE